VTFVDLRCKSRFHAIDAIGTTGTGSVWIGPAEVVCGPMSPRSWCNRSHCLTEFHNCSSHYELIRMSCFLTVTSTIAIQFTPHRTGAGLRSLGTKLWQARRRTQTDSFNCLEHFCYLVTETRKLSFGALERLQWMPKNCNLCENELFTWRSVIYNLWLFAERCANLETLKWLKYYGLDKDKSEWMCECPE
jgi:hypothetical protein